MNYDIIAILIVCVLFIFRADIETFVSRKKICNGEDHRCYNVVGKYDDPSEASRLLAHLNKFSIELMRVLRNKYINEPAVGPKIKFLLSNYNPDNIIENAPSGTTYTSYVDNKGEVFAICLREKESGKNKFHKLTDLEFVVMHEMAHLMTVEYDHSIRFWQNFKFLMIEANAGGLHTPKNYAKEPFIYCGLKVDYSPYYDDRLHV
jgi:hypothetical protein